MNRKLRENSKTKKGKGNPVFSFFENLSKEEKEKILRNTHKYSHVEKAKEGKFLTVLSFRLGKERFAIETNKLIETLRLRSFTPLPKTPDFIEGVVNVRGRILGLVNLKIFLGLKSSTPTNSSHIIILQNENFQFAVMVDEIFSVEELNLNSLTQKVISLEQETAKYVKGITPEGLILLDAEKIVNEPKLTIEIRI